MGTNKFLKARCKKTGRWYGLEVKQFGSTWKVVNMIDLSDSEAAVISSEVKQDSFETNDNLLACKKCGKRRVGGCSCARKTHQCSKNMKYHLIVFIATNWKSTIIFRLGLKYPGELEILLPFHKDKR